MKTKPLFWRVCFELASSEVSALTVSFIHHVSFWICFCNTACHPRAAFYFSICGNGKFYQKRSVWASVLARRLATSHIYLFKKCLKHHVNLSPCILNKKRKQWNEPSCIDQFCFFTIQIFTSVKSKSKKKKSISSVWCTFLFLFFLIVSNMYDQCSSCF